jgi:hypothetical protein
LAGNLCVQQKVQAAIGHVAPIITILSLPGSRNHGSSDRSPLASTAARARLYDMAKEDASQDLMGYDAMHQDAMRELMRMALLQAAAPGGLPGEHHFYVSFLTGAPGVTIPPDLSARYPEEMTIVLQNQFWDLNPGEDGFSVTLQFGGMPKGLTIPYTAVTRFMDPSVQFAIQMEPTLTKRKVAPALSPVATDPPRADGVNVVSFDHFRKR